MPLKRSKKGMDFKMKITDLLNKNAIRLNGTFKNKEEVIDKLYTLTPNGLILEKL